LPNALMGKKPNNDTANSILNTPCGSFILSIPVVKP
jgi:hypothetical protein